MLSKEEYQRYSKQLLLPKFGIGAQQQLKAARVLVIGAGGLGCPALQYLAAAGVGNIGIVDDDKVELSNLQRQILYTTASAGKYKATEAATFIQALNPLIEVNVYQARLQQNNATELISMYDVIIDASDNMETRYLVDEICRQQNKPWVFGAVYRYEGQVAVWNYRGGPTYNAIYPKEKYLGKVPDCETAGVLGVLPGIVGTLQASECIKIITGIGQPLSGQMLQINLLTMEMFTFTLSETKHSAG